MSAFGKRNGLGGGGQRPNFGVAKPMKSTGGKASASPPAATNSRRWKSSAGD